MVHHYDIPGAEEKNSEFAKKMNALTDKYKKDIDEHDAKVKDYRENLLQEEVDFAFHKVSFNDIPIDINQDEMDLIFPFIDNGEV